MKGAKGEQGDLGSLVRDTLIYSSNFFEFISSAISEVVTEQVVKRVAVCVSG